MPNLATAAEVLRSCGRSIVPVNLPLDVAIDAHCRASREYGQRSEEPGRTIVRSALQSILFARTPAADDLRRQLAYLVELPLEAWAWPGQNAEETREDWLRGISRCLTWMSVA